MDGKELVRAFWTAVAERRWADALALLDPNFVAEWPHTLERIRGRDNFIALNRAYPGAWNIELRSILAEGNRVVSRVVVTDPETGTFSAASFFEIGNDKILKVTELWVEHGSENSPAWRSQWVERM